MKILSIILKFNHFIFFSMTSFEKLHYQHLTLMGSQFTLLSFTFVQVEKSPKLSFKNHHQNGPNGPASPLRYLHFYVIVYTGSRDVITALWIVDCSYCTFHICGQFQKVTNPRPNPCSLQKLTPCQPLVYQQVTVSLLTVFRKVINYLCNLPLIVDCKEPPPRSGSGSEPEQSASSSSSPAAATLAARDTRIFRFDTQVRRGGSRVLCSLPIRAGNEGPYKGSQSRRRPLLGPSPC